MKTNDFNFELPENLIAKYPNEKRDEAKLLVINKNDDKIYHKKFFNIVDYFNKGDVLVLNDTKVIPARLFGLRLRLNEKSKIDYKNLINKLTEFTTSKRKTFLKEQVEKKNLSLAKIEVMLLKPLTNEGDWECLIKPSKRIREGEVIIFFKENISDSKESTISDNINYSNSETKIHTGSKSIYKNNKKNDGKNSHDNSYENSHNKEGGKKAEKEILEIKKLDFNALSVIKKIGENKTIKLFFGDKKLKQIGSIPLPPYIKRLAEENDKTMYQTVFAKNEGSVASPTASLHFTKELLLKLKKKGVIITYLTLNIGLGTFLPVKTEDLKKHKMHSEFFTISEKSAQIINKAISENRNIIASGTTVLRALESAAFKKGRKYFVKEFSGESDIFIYPQYKMKIVDKLITNFHTPKSTLLMLVSAFYDREKMLNIYAKAVEKKYKFFSYGDAMFITKF